MIEFSIGFIVGSLAVGLFKSTAIIGYNEELEETIKENKKLKEKIVELLKRNNKLEADNERLKNAFVWKVDK